jgi:aspartate carbamoyltransferase catalytic subunit
VHSLVRGLAHWNVSLRLVSPPSMKLASVLTIPLKRAVQVAEMEGLTEAMEGCDVVYVAPVVVEAFPRPAEAKDAQGWLEAQLKVLEQTGRDAGVMCPRPTPQWPDGGAGEMVEGPFRQAVNGVWVRAVVLALILGALPRS